METNIPWFEKEIGKKDDENRADISGQMNQVVNQVFYARISVDPISKPWAYQRKCPGPVPGAVDIELEMCHRVKYSGVAWPGAASLTPPAFLFCGNCSYHGVAMMLLKMTAIFVWLE